MIKFLANNLLDKAVLTPSTVNAQFPVNNIKDLRRTKFWRSTTNSDNLVIDLGAADSVDVVSIVDNWQTGFGVSTITVEANSTSNFSSPAFTTTLTFDEKFGFGIKEFTEVNYRFWRFVLTSTLGYCELSNFFIGKASTISTNGITFGLKYSERDMKKVSKTRYGQALTDDITTMKVLDSLAIKTMDETEADVIHAIHDEVRTIKPIFIQFCEDTSNITADLDRFNGLYKFKGDPPFTLKTAGFWDTAFQLEEVK